MEQGFDRFGTVLGTCFPPTSTTSQHETLVNVFCLVRAASLVTQGFAVLFETTAEFFDVVAIL